MCLGLLNGWLMLLYLCLYNSQCHLSNRLSMSMSVSRMWHKSNSCNANIFWLCTKINSKPKTTCNWAETVGDWLERSKAGEKGNPGQIKKENPAKQKHKRNSELPAIRGELEERQVGRPTKCGHFWKELKSLGNWVEMMWKAACNQNYKAPENYGQRLDIIHSLLRTLNVADQASDWDWGKARQGKKQILNSSEWTKFNDSKKKEFPTPSYLVPTFAPRRLVICFDLTTKVPFSFLAVKRPRNSPSTWNVCDFHRRLLNGRIFTFVSKFVAFYVANIELWLHKPPTAAAAQQKVETGRKLSLCLFFDINWIFPFGKHETKLLWGF